MKKYGLLHIINMMVLDIFNVSGSDENRESFFCLKSDLPEGLEDGAKVNFNALPTFDKKKSRESWRAVDVLIAD